MPFTFEQTALPGVVLVTPKVFSDDRGHFFEAYRQSQFSQSDISQFFVQDNQSWSLRGTVRGLHFQKGDKAQGKLVRCLTGEIWDVAVDIRPDSSTFGQWIGRTLTAATREMLWVPAGMAHGFQVISEEAEILYKCTAEYAPEAEGAIMWNDPELAIAWPLPEAELSEKDARSPSFAHFQEGLKSSA